MKSFNIASHRIASHRIASHRIASHRIAKQFLYSFIFLFVLTFPLSAKTSEPEWFQNWRTVYPDTEYIAQRGRGDTEEQSKTDALAQLARYFQTTVHANLTTSLQSISNGENNTETSIVLDEVSVMSNVELFAVEYTDAYYFKKEKKWYCVAFIKRDNAWNQYKTKVEDAKNTFYSIYNQANEEKDSVLKCGIYKSAFSSGKVFLETLEYARILTSKNEALYKEDRDIISGIPALIQKERSLCSIYIDIKGDYSNIISSTVSSCLSGSGFRVVKTKAEGNYICEIQISPNTSGSEPLSITPDFDLKLLNKENSTVYSLLINSEQKTVAYSLEKAQKKAYPLLAEKVSVLLPAGLADIF